MSSRGVTADELLCLGSMVGSPQEKGFFDASPSGPIDAYPPRTSPPVASRALGLVVGDSVEMPEAGGEVLSPAHRKITGDDVKSSQTFDSSGDKSAFSVSFCAQQLFPVTPPKPPCYVKSYVDFKSSVRNKELKDELDRVQDEFEKIFALAKKLEKENEGNLTKAKLKKRRENIKLINRWLILMALFRDPEINPSTKLMIAKSLENPAKTLLDKISKGFKARWIECNWYRLLLLRIKRILLGVGDTCVVLTAKSKAFAGLAQGFKVLYKVLGHLGYAIYFFRIYVHIIPSLLSAMEKEGWKGFKKVWQRESQSICNDVVWATVGLLTTFLFHSTFVCTMIVVGLYVFDVLNVLYHGNKKKRELERENNKVCGNMATLEVALSFNFNILCKQFRLAETQDKIAAAPDHMKQAMRQVFARQLVLDAKQENSWSLTNPEMDRIVECLAKWDRIQTLYQGNKDNMKAASIEAMVLLTGMIVSGMGTAIVCMSTSIGLGGAASISSLITGSTAIAGASAVFGPAAILGLAALAIGAAVVMGMCIYRLVRKIRLKEQEKRRNQGADVVAPSGISLFSKDEELLDSGKEANKLAVNAG